MNDESKGHKKGTEISSADDLVRTSAGDSIVLNEKELERVSGGACCTGAHIKGATITVRR